MSAVSVAYVWQTLTLNPQAPASLRCNWSSTLIPGSCSGSMSGIAFAGVNVFTDLDTQLSGLSKAYRVRHPPLTCAQRQILCLSLLMSIPTDLDTEHSGSARLQGKWSSMLLPAHVLLLCLLLLLLTLVFKIPWHWPLRPEARLQGDKPSKLTAAHCLASMLLF